jgi:hypothetical protein
MLNKMNLKNSSRISSASVSPFFPVKLASGFDLDVFSLMLSCGSGRSVKLGHKEFQCLWILDQVYPGGVRREAFMRAIWPHKNMNPGSLDVHFSSLRTKLNSLGFEIGLKLKLYSLIDEMSESAARTGSVCQENQSTLAPSDRVQTAVVRRSRQK